MKKLLVLIAALTTCSLLPSVSQAACVATGTVPRVFVQGAVTNIGVRANGAGTTFFNVTTNNLAFISAALVAEAQMGRARFMYFQSKTSTRSPAQDTPGFPMARPNISKDSSRSSRLKQSKIL